MKQLLDSLKRLLADNYTLYLKTQNYHWHVRGPNFKELHELFEQQYLELAQAVDLLAERILALRGKAPATFKEFLALQTLKEGSCDYSSAQMLTDLYEDHGKILTDLRICIELAQTEKDEGTINILSDRIAAHEKIRWMLDASKATDEK